MKVLSSQEADSTTDISIVCPVGSIQGDLAAIHREVCRILLEMGLRAEFLYILDGPRPDAEEALSKIEELTFPVHVYQTGKGFGEATALQYGFDKAAGRYVITIPAHHQVELSAIPTILDHLEKGYEVVVAARHPRQDALYNRVQSRMFHWLIRRLFQRSFHDVTCALRGFAAEAARKLDLYADFHLFIPLIAVRHGFQILELPVAQRQEDRSPRTYRPGDYVRRLLDVLNILLLTRFTRKPLRFFGIAGALLSLAGGALCLFMTAERLLGLTALADRPLLLFGVLLIVSGVQVASIGLLAEIIIFHSPLHDRPHAKELGSEASARDMSATPEFPARSAKGREAWLSRAPQGRDNDHPPRRHCQANAGRRQSTDGITVSTPPLWARNHQPRGLAVPSVHAELSRRRGPSRRTRHRRVLRER